MPDLEQTEVTTPAVAEPKKRFFVRFTREQRTMHAVLFSTFFSRAFCIGSGVSSGGQPPWWPT